MSSLTGVLHCICPVPQTVLKFGLTAVGKPTVIDFQKDFLAYAAQSQFKNRFLEETASSLEVTAVAWEA